MVLSLLWFPRLVACACLGFPEYIPLPGTSADTCTLFDDWRKIILSHRQAASWGDQGGCVFTETPHAHADMSATAGPRVALLPHRARARARATRASASSNPPAASSAATSTSNTMLPSPPTPAQLYAADARQTRYGANVARYLVDLHDHPPGATFNFCGGMMFGLVLSDALRSHLATVAANGESDPAQPVVQARSPSHRFPYDRVRVVNADP